MNEALSLKSITSYRDLEYGTELDLDGTPRNAFGIFYFNDQEQISQEIQFNYQTEKMSLVSGIYYYKEEGDTFDGGVFNNFLIAVTGEATFETRSKAVFGQVDYDLNEQLTIILGMRYTEEEKDYSRTVEDINLTALAGIQFSPTGAVSYANPSLLSPGSRDLTLGGVGVARPAANPDTANFDNFSPKIGFKYQVDDNTNVYASVSSGFKSGGFNGRLADGQLDPYDEETLLSYEFGFKTELLSKRLRFNTALFYNNYEDLQVSSFEAQPGGGGILPVFSNAGEAVMKGAEFEIMALVSENLSLTFNLGYLDSEYKEFLAGVDPVTNTVIDVSDQRELVNAPKWDGFLGLNYDLTLNDWGTLSFTTDISYRSKTYLEVNSSEVLAQSGYSVINAGLTFYSSDEKWRVMLGGKNLSDKEYRTHSFDLTAFPGVQLGYYNPPRTYSLTASYSF